MNPGLRLNSIIDQAIKALAQIEPVTGMNGTARTVVVIELTTDQDEANPTRRLYFDFFGKFLADSDPPAESPVIAPRNWHKVSVKPPPTDTWMLVTNGTLVDAVMIAKLSIEGGVYVWTCDNGDVIPEQTYWHELPHRPKA